MKFENTTRWTVIFASAIFILASSLAPLAHASDKDKKDTSKPTLVDSGTFGIFIKGQRVATETFSIEQRGGINVIKSQLKETGGADAASQKSDLELTPSGELLRYEWSQASGGSLSVVPENEFLKERITVAGTAKTAEQAFLLPNVTPILDNNFFVHRQVLAWKYLAIAPCKNETGQRHCQAADFGALVPQDRTSISVHLELVGKEKIMLRGAERELLRLNLTGDDLQWNLWLDESDHFKLMRLAIPADNTEVVRE